MLAFKTILLLVNIIISFTFPFMEPSHLKVLLFVLFCTNLVVFFSKNEPKPVF